MTLSLISRGDFEAVFSTLVQDLTEYVQKYKIPDQALKWFQNVRTLNEPIAMSLVGAR